MRVAIVHDWLTGMRGGEKCLQAFCEALPQAELFTLVHLPGKVSERIEAHPIHASFLNGLPGIEKRYRHLLPVMPAAIGQLDVSDFDLVLSSSHCVAKGIAGRRPGQLHVCYCYSPMRYIWDVAGDYQQRLGMSGLVLKTLTPWLRAWDRRSAQRVDEFIAISDCIADRIRRCYGRCSEVLYPLVDTHYYSPAEVPREDFYLVVSALAPYKLADQAIEAFGQLGLPLKVIGSGQLLDSFRRNAPANVELLGWQDDEVLRDHYRRCKALVFPQLEDFGIVPLEAMACGAPVIAFAGGGALETVRDASDPACENPTGLLYRPQTVKGLVDAVRRFEAMDVPFDPVRMRDWARRFSPERFSERFRALLTGMLDRAGLPLPW